MKTRHRLPAYGRAAKARLVAGLRPVAGGGAIVVTTDWDYATPFARLVCAPEEPMDRWDFSYLRGTEVIILVPERYRLIGQHLTEQVRLAGAALAVLVVNVDAQP